MMSVEFIVISVIISWIVFAVVIGAVASTKGKEFGLWFFLSILISPLLAGFCLLITLMPSKTNSDLLDTKDDFEEKWLTLAKYDEGTKKAVKQLEAYGSDAIDELKKVFRATNSPTCLPLVVDEIAKNIQIKNELNKQKLAEQAAREVQNKIEADKIRVAEQAEKEAKKNIWNKRTRYALFGITVLSIICGAVVMKNNIDESNRKAAVAAERKMLEKAQAAEREKINKKLAIERERVEKEKAEIERAKCYTDPQTGLTWVANGNIAGIAMNWDQAMVWVTKLNYLGYRDWRLPSRSEFNAFVKRGGNSPSTWFNNNGFNGVSGNFYWSGSTNTDSPDRAWGVNMINGLETDYNKSYNGGSIYVWPVRSGR